MRVPTEIFIRHPRSPSVHTHTQLSIYDAPSDPITLIPEAPSALQRQVSSIRKTSEVLYRDTKVKLREVSNSWVGVERKVECEW